MLVAALMITQSFLYNAIFFTYGLALFYKFFHAPFYDTLATTSSRSQRETWPGR